MLFHVLANAVANMLRSPPKKISDDWELVPSGAGDTIEDGRMLTSYTIVNDWVPGGSSGNIGTGQESVKSRLEVFRECVNTSPIL